MRYPVGVGTKEDFEKDWYVADGFGSNRGSYFHSGVDINLRTGGDTDLGSPLYPIYSGKIKYYHYSSHPTSSYGRHLCLEIEGPWGKRWVHYAHCDKNGFVGEVKEVNEDDTIAKIGKSGTGYAHLHLSLFKVDPATLERGIDTIARTRNELDKYFENPLTFISKWYNYTQPVMSQPDYIETLLRDDLNLDIHTDEGTFRGRVGEIKDKLKGYDDLQKKVSKLQKEIAEVAGERSQLKEWLEASDESRKELEKEVKQLKESLIIRDKEVSDIKNSLEKLQESVDPDKYVSIPIEEHARLTRRRNVDRYSTRELISELVRRVLNDVKEIVASLIKNERKSS